MGIRSLSKRPREVIGVGGPILWSSLGVVANQDVTIPNGTTVLLDGDFTATSIGFLTINSGGSLVGTSGGIGLTTKGIMVMGSFLMGTSSSPISSCTFNYTGVDPVWPTFSTYKSVINGDTSGGIYRSHMVMSGGVSKVYVSHPTTMRASLAANASSSATSLTLDTNVGWASGSDVAISPDDYYTGSNRTEVKTLASAATTAASLTAGLGYARFGVMQYPIDVATGTNGVSLTQGTWTNGTGGTQPTSFDERAKVMLLTMGGKFQGANDTSWTTNGIGMHAMCMPGGIMYFEGCQFDRCGQDGRVARYPVHFHMLSFTPGSPTQFISSNGNAPTFISTTSFSVSGDQTAKFPNLQAVSFTSSNTGRGYVNTSVFSGGITTVSLYQFSPTSDSSFNLSGNLTGLTSVLVIAGGGTATGFDTSQSGAKYCVVKNSKLRAFVVHGTDGITIQDCNAYNVNGAAFFLEDGVENNNTFLRCSIFGTNDPGSTRIKDFDRYLTGGGESMGQGPAGFWITNLNNTVQDCWAADCQGIGFWNALSFHAFGLSNNVSGRRGLFQQMVTNVFANNRTWSNGSHNILTRGGAVDDLGNVDASNGYYPSNTGNPPVGHGGSDTNIPFTLFGTISHHCTTIGYSNAVGSATYDSWAVSSVAEVMFFGAADETSRILSGLLAGFTTRTSGATPLNTAQTKHANASYHRSLNVQNTSYVNFPFGNRETLTDFGATDNQLWMGSGATRTFDLYENYMETGSRRDTNNFYVNSHRGFRSQSPNIDGRVMSSDHRFWVIAGVEWDYNNSWGGGADTYLMPDLPFFTFGASGLVDVLPLSSNQGKASTSRYYGIAPAEYNGGGFNAGLSLNVLAHTWNQMDATGATSQGSYAYHDNSVASNGSRFAGSPFHHASLRNGGIYTFTSPVLPSSYLHLNYNAFNNFSGMTGVIRVDWSGSVVAKVGFKSCTFDGFNFGTNFHINNGYGAGAGGASYGNTALSLSDLLSKTTASATGAGGKGLWIWQDVANNFLWIKIFSGQFAWNPSGGDVTTNPLNKLALEQQGTIEVVPGP